MNYTKEFKLECIKNPLEVSRKAFHNQVRRWVRIYESLGEVGLEHTRKRLKTAVNLSMVYTYYEIGKMIVEEEQNGNNRAEYGKYILKKLSEYLTDKFGKGFSVTNLKMIRKFYLTYENDQISQTVFDQFKNLPKTDNGRQFYLSWSHYLQLMRISNIDARHFYELEAVKTIGVYQK